MTDEETKETDGMECTLNLKIKIKKQVYDKISWFTHNYSEEISGFLTGEIKEDILIVDDILFPHQDVSSASVETEPKDLVKLRQEYGDKCLRIVGHWHSHNTMTAFWSVTDDTFIDEYSKTRDLTLFLVSSTQSKPRALLVLQKPFDIRFDNMDYEVEWDNNTYEESLRKVIKDKVTKKVTPITNYGYGYGVNYNYGEDSSIKWHGWENPGSTKTIQGDDYMDIITDDMIQDVKGKKIRINHLSYPQALQLKEETKEYPSSLKKYGDAFGDHSLIYDVKNPKDRDTMITEIRFYVREIVEEQEKESNTYYGT